ncbi:MAG: hypothetical protein U9N42_05500 [Campylobacterota bacterium]|nr:hypothetical protein [Campylobacterota bacterium]
MEDYEFKSLQKVELSPKIRRIWVITLLIFIALIVMLFLPWQQTVRGQGTLIAYDSTQRDYSILAPIDGFIDEFYVGENEFVKKGAKLFHMVDLDENYILKLQNNKEALEAQYSNTELELLNLENNKNNIEKNLEINLELFSQKETQLRDKIKSLKLKKIFFEKSYEIQNENFKRVKLLYRDGIESKRVFENAENSFVKSDAQLKKLRVDIDVELRNIEILKEEKKRFLVDTNTQIKSMQNRIISTNSRLKSLTQQLTSESLNIDRYKSGEVVAKKDGYVVRIFKNDKNKFIKKGEEVLHFSPIVSEKAIRLKVSDFNMPLIKEGLKARIMFYGWPALQISGWPKIQYGSFAGVIKKVEHVSHDRGYFYAYIVQDAHEPWPKGDELRVGTQASVWVRLSTVPIWYQLWRLMNALPPKMVHPKTKQVEL